MEFFSPTECESWCTRFASPESTHNASLDSGAKALELDFSKASEIPFARTIIDFLLKQGPVLIWIKAWSENSIFVHVPLYQRFCETLGGSQSIAEAPGLLFDPSERNDAISAMIIMLNFSWSLELHAAQANLSISQEEYCYFKSNHLGTLTSGQSALRDWIVD
jgi:hypothetical protein